MQQLGCPLCSRRLQSLAAADFGATLTSDCPAAIQEPLWSISKYIVSSVLVHDTGNDTGLRSYLLMYLAVGTTTAQGGESRSEIGIRGYADPLISYVALATFFSQWQRREEKKLHIGRRWSDALPGPRGRNVDWPGGEAHQHDATSC